MPEVGTASENEPVWKPIGTAPRNGEGVLAWSENTKTYHVLAFDEAPPAGWVSQSADYVILRDDELSHWTPLPPPPDKPALNATGRGGWRAARNSTGLPWVFTIEAMTAAGLFLGDWFDLIP
jgi:hypothetical protein